MTVPDVIEQKADGQTSVSPDAVDGIAAIIAPSASGTVNQPTSCTRMANALTSFGYGILPDYAAYIMSQSEAQTTLVKASASTAGTYSTITSSSGGTAVIAAGGTTPLDAFDVSIVFINAITLGTAGGQWKYSLNGGRSYSDVQSLSTALSIVIPNTGITVTLGTTGELIPAGKTVTFTTTAPSFSSSDLTVPLEALRTTYLPWECVYVTGDCDDTHIGVLNNWLQVLEGQGQFKFAVVNTVMKTAAQSEADYAAALAPIYQAAPNIRSIVCADGADIISPTRSIAMKRPTALAVVARTMGLPLGTLPEEISLGPLSDVSITDARGNGKYHDEALNPGLDDLRFTTLRSVNRKPGVYINNSRIFSTQTSDYQFIAHVRVANRACQITYDTLVEELSKGFTKSPKKGPDGQRYISELSASAMEAILKANLKKGLKGQVNDVSATIARDDDVSSNQGATITVTVAIESLGYIKSFKVSTGFVKSI